MQIPPNLKAKLNLESKYSKFWLHSWNFHQLQKVLDVKNIYEHQIKKFVQTLYSRKFIQHAFKCTYHVQIKLFIESQKHRDITQQVNKIEDMLANYKTQPYQVIAITMSSTNKEPFPFCIKSYQQT